MSRFLSEPITVKDSAVVSGHGVVVGRSAMQGWRDTMEVRARASRGFFSRYRYMGLVLTLVLVGCCLRSQDKDIVQMPIDSSAKDACCVGVFDGHGGKAISAAVCVRQPLMYELPRETEH